MFLTTMPCEEFILRMLSRNLAISREADSRVLNSPSRDKGSEDGYVKEILGLGTLLSFVIFYYFMLENPAFFKLKECYFLIFPSY